MRNRNNTQRFRSIITDKESQKLKRFTIDKIAAIRREESYYVVLVDLDKEVSTGIIKTRKLEAIAKQLEIWNKKVFIKIKKVSHRSWELSKNIVNKLML